MLISDYIAHRIKIETDTVFGITGGAIVNLFDALNKRSINVVNMHHEQSCAMAADAYARVSGGLGVVIGTSGPGATNLITGTCCSWFDSTPVLTIVGQVPTSHLKTGNLRQKGFQETDTVELFKSITKSSKRMMNAQDLEDAINLAKDGRPGPTFLELCDDIQRSNQRVEISMPKQKKLDYKAARKLKHKLEKLLKKSNRPVLIIGAGVKQAKVEEGTIEFINRLGIPTFLTWGAMDLLPHDSPLNCRDFGVTSQRIGNFAIKHADLVICIGTKLDTHNVGTNWTDGKVVIIDIDEAELAKNKGIKIQRDLKCVPYLEPQLWLRHSWWLSRIQNLRFEYPLPKTMPYEFIRKLSEATPEKSIIITDAGQTLTWTMMAWKVKEDQKLFSAFNHSPMGYALPASIGAYYASPKSNIICISGDGGFQMNLQELSLIGQNKLPIKIFVLNNKGYGMMKQTQSDWDALKVGVAANPVMTDLKKIAKCFGLKYFNSLNFPKILKEKGPCLVEVMIPEFSKIEPKLKFGDEFTDLSPKLSKNEKRKIEKTLKKK